MTKNKEKNKFASQMYRGTKMGTTSLKNILTKVEDQNLKNTLLRQLENYQKIENKLYEDLLLRGVIPNDLNPFLALSSWLTIGTQTLFDKTPSNIATILIKGNNMGVIGFTKILNSSEEIDDFLKGYALQYINLVEENTEQLKKFL